MTEEIPTPSPLPETTNNGAASLQRQLIIEAHRCAHLFQRARHDARRNLRRNSFSLDLEDEAFAGNTDAAFATESDGNTDAACAAESENHAHDYACPKGETRSFYGHHGRGRGNFAPDERGVKRHEMAEAMCGQGRLLRQLSNTDGLQMKDIVEAFDIRPSSASELVAKLQKRGLVRTETDAADKRVRRVFITDEGREYIQKMLSSHKEFHDELFGIITEDEQKILLELLQKINARLSERTR